MSDIIQFPLPPMNGDRVTTTTVSHDLPPSSVTTTEVRLFGFLIFRMITERSAEWRNAGGGSADEPNP